MPDLLVKPDDLRDLLCTDDDDELTHLWCSVCSPDGSLALCGASLEDSDEVFDDEDALICVVCADFDKSHPCPRGF